MSPVVAHVSEGRVHLTLELGHVLEDTDSTCHATAGMEHEVLAVVRPQQLHMLGHPDGADQVDQEQEDVGGGHGPEDDDHRGQGLDTQQIPVSFPDQTIITENKLDLEFNNVKPNKIPPTIPMTIL